MDSASPIASRIAGQPSLHAGETIFGNATRKGNTAEFGLAVTFLLDWLSGRPDRARHRDPRHRPATGEATSP